jgi:molybdenum cofactor guanylyltransferase
MTIDSACNLTKSDEASPCKDEVSLTAIILAGGKSSRMGQDKALIQIDGIPLLQKVYQVAAACCQQVIVVTPWQDRYQQLLPNTCKFVQEMHLPEESDNTQNHGPLVGFAQALATVQTEWVLLLACDLPNLDVPTLKVWANELNTIEDHFIAALVKHHKGWEPLCGFYRQLCLPSLNEFINEGGRSFQKWLAQNPVAILPNSAPEILFNCNTPEDLININVIQLKNK